MTFTPKGNLLNINMTESDKKSAMADLNIGEKIKLLRHLKGFRQEDLAKKTGLTQSYISNIEKGAEPSIKTLSKIANALGMTLQELISWTPEKETKETLRRRIERLEALLLASKEIAVIPVYNRVNAGFPDAIPDPEYIEGHIFVPGIKEKDAFGFIVEGNSMEPTLHEGDIIVVSRYKTPTKKDIVFVVLKDGSVTVKRYSPTNGQVVLIPDNPEYDPMIYKPEDVSFIGVVVARVEVFNKK